MYHHASSNSKKDEKVSMANDSEIFLTKNQESRLYFHLIFRIIHKNNPSKFSKFKIFSRRIEYSLVLNAIDLSFHSFEKLFEYADYSSNGHLGFSRSRVFRPSLLFYSQSDSDKHSSKDKPELIFRILDD